MLYDGDATMNSNEPTTPEQLLCVSCGLCCNGTIFGKVFLKPADDEAPLEAGGIEIQTKETEKFFELSCAAHQENCCQVYAVRPTNCRSYQCELLKKYESGSVSWRAAQSRISQARTLREKLRIELAQILPDADQTSVNAVLKIVPEHQEIIADPVLLKTWAVVTMHLSALLDCVRTHFQPPRKNRKLHEEPKNQATYERVKKNF